MHVQAVDNFRNNVRSAMQAKQLSQEVLAHSAGLSRPFLNRVLQGKQEPSMEVCDRIADALKTPLATLISSPKKFLKNLPTALAS